MIIINKINDSTWLLKNSDGVGENYYPSLFYAVGKNNNVQIISKHNSKYVLANSEFTNFEIDGVIPVTIEECVSKINDIVFKSSSSGGSIQPPKPSVLTLADLQMGYNLRNHTIELTEDNLALPAYPTNSTALVNLMTYHPTTNNTWASAQYLGRTLSGSNIKVVMFVFRPTASDSTNVSMVENTKFVKHTYTYPDQDFIVYMNGLPRSTEFEGIKYWGFDKCIVHKP